MAWNYLVELFYSEMQADLYAFLKAMHEAWISYGQPTEPSPAALLTELLDIIRPANPHKICLQDLMVNTHTINSSFASTAIRQQLTTSRASVIPLS